MCLWGWPAQGMALDNTELREYTNGMLAHLAETLGEEFHPFLPSAVQAAIASCSQVQRSHMESLMHCAYFTLLLDA